MSIFLFYFYNFRLENELSTFDIASRGDYNNNCPCFHLNSNNINIYSSSCILNHFDRYFDFILTGKKLWEKNYLI